MRRIVVSAPLIGEQRTGPEVHLTEVIRAMFERRPGLQLCARHASVRGAERNRASAARIDPRVQTRTVPVPTTVLRPLQAALRVPPERCLMGRFDIFHQFHTDADPAVPGRKLVVTLHDTVALDWPDAEGPMYPHAGRLLRRAAAVLTGSHFSKSAICAAFDVDPARVHVAYNGVNHTRFVPGPEFAARPDRYVLCVGGHTPRKNLERAIAAFSRARSELGRPDLRLVLAGPAVAAERSLRAGAPPDLPAEAIDFVGHVADADVVTLYQQAEALLYPSLYEGFGMPVLEAQACGTPVVAGRGSALSEIAGPAVLVDPTDTEAISTGLVHLLTASDDRRADTRAAGIEHAGTFTWQRCADTVLSVYDTIADPGAGQ